MVGLADLAMESDGDCVTVTVTWLEVAVTGVLEGEVPAATAVSLMLPWFMSAWVTV